ncbi:MAG: hypothetical protein WC139_04630 [Candidatus Kapaibacterium sp.]
MNTGPSKEQIDQFYRTSRKYFDDLAKQYYEKDREFYNKYFAPYYSNPLLAVRKKTSSTRVVISVSVILFLVATAAIGFLFLTIESSENKKEQEIMKYMEGVKEDEYDKARTLIDSLSRSDTNVERMLRPLIPKDNDDGGSKSARDKGRKPQ